jgi:hypothetical protein
MRWAGVGLPSSLGHTFDASRRTYHGLQLFCLVGCFERVRIGRVVVDDRDLGFRQLSSLRR